MLPQTAEEKVPSSNYARAALSALLVVAGSDVSCVIEFICVLWSMFIQRLRPGCQVR